MDDQIYYMRDNHTFKTLSKDKATALAEILKELTAGYTSGALCSKRAGFSMIHCKDSAQDVFLLQCDAALCNP